MTAVLPLGASGGSLSLKAPVKQLDGLKGKGSCESNGPGELLVIYLLNK